MTDKQDKRGYGKPPASGRFTKGQSGNPKGRPKKKKPDPLKLQDAPLSSQLEAEAYRPLRLQENGRPIELPASQALIRSILVSPLKSGNRLALKQAYELLKAEEEKAVHRSIDRYRYYADLKKRGEAEMERCVEKKLPPPELYPHPADILLDSARMEVRVVGPQSPEEVPPYEKQALQRDLFLALLARLMSKDPTAPWPVNLGALMIYMADTVNALLPPSRQRSEASISGFLTSWYMLSKKQQSKQFDLLAQDIDAISVDTRSAIQKRDQLRSDALTNFDAIGHGFNKIIDAVEKRKRGQDPEAA